VDVSLGHRPEEHVVYLDEDVYVVIGDDSRAGTERSVWPATGTYGPIPDGAVVGRLGDVLGAIGAELWQAKRRGDQACLLAQLERYDAATVLTWGADCVEHLARRVNGVDGNVAETLALAREYARSHEFQPDAAHRLAKEAQATLERLRRGGFVSLGAALISRATELSVGFFGLLGPTETRYEADEWAGADLRAMQVALLHASKELCGADPLAAGREAARWCRRASARNALAQEAGDRANAAYGTSWWNLFLNPLAIGTLARSLPFQSKAIQDGDKPEAEWQAARLGEYLLADEEQD
jgi:hypothetical protein